MKIKTVRVAIAINKDGTWNAFGTSNARDAALRFAVAGFKKRGGRIVVIEVPAEEEDT